MVNSLMLSYGQQLYNMSVYIYIYISMHQYYAMKSFGMFARILTLLALTQAYHEAYSTFNYIASVLDTLSY